MTVTAADDELDYFRLAVDSLEDAGWTVHHGHDGDEYLHATDERDPDNRAEIMYWDNRFRSPPGICTLKEHRDCGALVLSVSGYSDTIFREAFAKMEELKAEASFGRLIGVNLIAFGADVVSLYPYD